MITFYRDNIYHKFDIMWYRLDKILITYDKILINISLRRSNIPTNGFRNRSIPTQGFDMGRYALMAQDGSKVSISTSNDDKPWCFKWYIYIIILFSDMIYKCIIIYIYVCVCSHMTKFKHRFQRRFDS